MLGSVEQEKTPLTKQLDQLTVLITIMAAAALALIVILGLARGEDFDTLFRVGITLAIAAIPTGLPAVVTMLLSIGTQRLADRGAIIKRLKSVETLGSTSAIAQPDDRARARRRRPAVLRRRRGLRHRGPHPPCRR
jgi:Ca2+-transporting ATPase